MMRAMLKQNRDRAAERASLCRRWHVTASAGLRRATARQRASDRSAGGRAEPRHAALARAPSDLAPAAPALMLALTLAFTVAFGQDASAQRARVEPEAATGHTERSLAIARRHMVAAGHPLAAEAGREMLRNGGNAIDAAIATALVLNLVEPQSSGIGGGGFLLYHHAATARLYAWDGRETAPAAARGDRFLADGKPMPFMAAVRSGSSVGVPGLVRMMGDAHAAHGHLPWAALFVPAIRLARQGVPMSPRLHALLRVAGPDHFDAAARATFFTISGAPVAVGGTWRNPDMERTLLRLAFGGAAAFYEGETARAIVDTVAGALGAADMTLADIAAYRAVARAPVCTSYRSRRVCGVGPPSSGGMTVAQILALIEPLDGIAGGKGALQVHGVHAIAEAEKLAYADRDRYLADPAFVAPPAGYLDSAYIASRRRLIDRDAAMPPPPAGEPPGIEAPSPGDDATIERGGTTHVSIIDGEGNAVAFTLTIEGAFGSGLMAAGFLLNNELTDFSFRPVDESGRAVANRVEGGKRPRSSMAPTIVYDAGGKVEAVLGSPGGNRIILYVVKALHGLIDLQLDAQQAADLANFGNRGLATELERHADTKVLAADLMRRGHHVVIDEMTSGLNIVVRREGRLEGGVDPRREGLAIGD